MDTKPVLCLAATLAGAPVFAIDRWESPGDNGSYTNNELQPGVPQIGHDMEPENGLGDDDWYKVRIHEGRSYEARVFGGGVVWQYPACADCSRFDRVTSQGDVITPGDAETTLGPPGQSVRWIAGLDQLEWLRVKQGPGYPGSVYAKYDILLVDTTLFLPRFNDTGGQRTIVIVQNIHDGPVSGQITFHDAQGARLHVQPFTIVAHGSLVLDTSSIAALAGKSGSATVAHTGGWSALVGKGVSVEPSTGFAFDTPLTSVPR
jgi:hypothetical protein